MHTQQSVVLMTFVWDIALCSRIEVDQGLLNEISGSHSGENEDANTTISRNVIVRKLTFVFP
jgi:hypothetical protein